MDTEHIDFKKLAVRSFPARELRETPEGRYWRRFKSPLTSRQIGPVTSVEFCQDIPNNLVITSSTRVLMYDAAAGRLIRKFSRFKDKAYGGTVRSDGKLLAAGGETGIVQVFDANSRALLRQLLGHNRPVHSVKFSTDRLHLLSGGDDATARWWDLTTGEQLRRLNGHADYIRAVGCNPANADIWATTSYDHTCKLWDVRSAKSMTNLDHGAPIESLAFFPSGSVLATAGGSYICLWDMYSGGRLLQKLRSHQKTITSVIISTNAGLQTSEGPRMLSASLDGHVKVYDLVDCQVVHSSKYPSPILDIGISPDASALAVGLADGTLSVRKKPANDRKYAGSSAKSRASRYAPKLTASSFRYFIRGQTAKASADAFVIAAQRKASISKYDRLLRQFHYGEALTAALDTKRPEIVSSVLEELISRGGLSTALNGSTADTILPLVSHLCSYITDPRYTQSITPVAHQLLDMYGGLAEAGGGFLKRLEQLREKVSQELKVQEELLSIKGMLETLIATTI